MGGALAGASVMARRVQGPSPFASQIASLSEPAGYFDTDNLISNERSYLDVVPALKAAGVSGGAYLGISHDVLPGLFSTSGSPPVAATSEPRTTMPPVPASSELGRPQTAPSTPPTQLVKNELLPTEPTSAPAGASAVWALIPGLSDRMAHEFEEYRPYTSLEQFRREIGKYVPAAEVARLEQYVFVPMNLNSAPGSAFLTIPKMTQRMVHEFEEYRPYTGFEQFRREIGKYVDQKEVARFERYLVIE